MITEQDTYTYFRQSQSRFISRPYRLPKDFDKFFNTRLAAKNKEALEIITKWFNTKWSNIDCAKFFDCGFELFGKNFSYIKFFDRHVINFYKERDKNIKRTTISMKKSMLYSIIFIKKFMKERSYRPDISLLTQYSLLTLDGLRSPVYHYIKNDIDKYFLTFLISRKHLALNDNDRMLIPLVIENYRKYCDDIKSDSIFIRKILNKI